MQLEITRKQKAFIDAGADEIFFGGAAGGGKSYGQLVDAFLYALRYAGSKQLVLRRTFPELEKTLITGSLALFPRSAAKYSDGKHRWTFRNGSSLDFGYCDSEKDVYQYQGAEYDVVRFDELTHFTEFMYLYLISRVRGVNDFPKQVKSTGNPGGVGHSFVKARFIDPAPPGNVFRGEAGTRQFIPSLVRENRFLMEKDPGYVTRLENLPERERRALLCGDWDAYEGQFFGEFSREVHTCRPFPLPKHWRIYRTLDYGLDMLCCLWVAVDEFGRAVVYKELYQPDLIVSAAARRIHEVNGNDEVYQTLAPRDLWNRRQETGRSAADIFADNGIHLTKTSNERVPGWLSVKEWLSLRADEQGRTVPGLRIFDGCLNLIRTLPALQADEKNPSDVANEPHELTHAPDALRGFCVWWTTAATPPPRKAVRSNWTRDMLDDYYAANDEVKKLLRQMWGDP